MQENLVIVESPAKAKTIEKFLGKDFKVMSSYGHIRDLRKKEISIDLDTLGTTTATVTAKPVEVTWGATTFTYNGQEQKPTVTTPVAGVNSESIALTVTGAGTNVGDYTATANIANVTGGQAKANNYTLTGNTKGFKIERAKTATATANTGLVYNGQSQTGVTGNYVTWTGTTDAIDASDSYTATATPDSNHAWSDGTTTAREITWEIAKKEVAVTWGTTRTWTYDGNEHAPTVTTPVRVIAGESIELTVAGAEANAGSYTAAASMASVTGGRERVNNYILTDNIVDFMIEKAHINVVVKISGTAIYGEKLTAETTVDPSDAELTYQWYESTNTEELGTPIPGETSEEYIVGDLLGKYISVQVIAKKDNYYDATSSDMIKDKVSYRVTYLRDENVEAISKTEELTNTGKVTLPSMTVSTGYSASGWYEDTTKVGNAEEEITVTGNVTLTAKAIVNSYTVTLDGNGATIPATETEVTVTYNQAMPMLISLPSRTGYTFTGYYDEKTGGTKYYNDDGTNAKIWDKASDSTLYAQWESNTYQIEYYQGNNSATAGSTKLSGTTNAIYNTNVTLQKYAGTVPTGWTFAGWSTTQDGKTVEYTDEAIVRNLTETANDIVKLYAVFERTINVYSGLNKATNNARVQYLNPYTNSNVTQISLAVPTDIPNWTKLGYRTDITASESQVAVTTEAVNVTPDNSTTPPTYYAVYSRELTMTYDGNTY